MNDSGFVIIDETEGENLDSSEEPWNMNSMGKSSVKSFSSELVENSDKNQGRSSRLTEPVAKRELGIFSGIAIVVGCSIGSGIFITPNEVLEFSGSVASSLLIWIVCGLISCTGAICYLELGAMLPVSGGEYSYFLRGYGKFMAYSYSWMSTMLMKPVQVAANAKIFGIYLIQPFIMNKNYSKTKEALLIQLISAAAIIVLAIINCLSVNWAARIQITCTVTKVITIVFIVVLGFVKIGQGHTSYLAMGFNTINPEQRFSVGKVSKAFFYGLWAYEGWNMLNLVTEEIKNPQKNLPRSILFGMPFVVTIFFISNVAYLAVLSPNQIINSTAVAFEWSNVVLGSFFDNVQVIDLVYPFIIPILVALSCFGVANGIIFTSARLIFAASRQGHMMEIFSYIHAKTLTPAPSIILITLISIFIDFTFNISDIIDMYNILAWFFYGLTFGAVVFLRVREGELVRPIKVWIVMPVLLVIICAFLVLSSIVDDPQLYYLYIFIVYAVGVMFYFVCVYKNIKPKWLKAINDSARISLNFVPPQYID